MLHGHVWLRCTHAYHMGRGRACCTVLHAPALAMELPMLVPVRAHAAVRACG